MGCDGPGRPPQVVTMSALDEQPQPSPPEVTTIELYSCPDCGALYWNFHQCSALTPQQVTSCPATRRHSNGDAKAQPAKHV